MIDRCVILSALAMLCILYGVLALGPDTVEIQEEPIFEVILEVVEVEPEPWKPAIEKERKTYYFERDITEDHIDEIQTALFYATVPIGRYYITAYSHMETGSKITASGEKVHQGTITTAAADVPKYFRFGDYVEVDGRIYRIEDTGSAVKKRHLDLYEPDMKKLNSYTSYKQVYRVVFPFGTPKDN